jgi:hypothetical protein
MEFLCFELFLVGLFDLVDWLCIWSRMLLKEQLTKLDVVDVEPLFI